MCNTDVSLTGSSLTFADLRIIGSGRGRVVASADGMRRVRVARQALEGAVASGRIIYGVNTGVGAMKDVAWDRSSVTMFNLGLVRAHHFGTGECFPPATIRKAIAIRVNTLLKGRTGCSPGLVEAYLDLLRADAIPLVRRTGSIGCADIGLMGQIGTALTGEGEVFFRGCRWNALDALRAAGLAPLVLAPRDALASLAVNSVAFAAAAAGLRRAALAARILSVIALFSSAVLGASRDPWRAAMDIGSSDQSAIAHWFWDNSEPIGWHDGCRLQDPLSLRMLPQVFGAVIGQLRQAGRAVLDATSSIDDNPVIMSDEVLTSGGSLPLDVSLALQTCQLVLAHVARNVFNRCCILLNGGRRGLPVNLVPPGMAATGFGPALKLVGDLYVRSLTLSSPLSPQQLVVANGIEDEASFLPLIIERLEEQVDALLHMAALEALFAAQAGDILGDTLGGAATTVHNLVREHSDVYKLDRPLSAEIESLRRALSEDSSADRLLQAAPLQDFDAFFAIGGSPEIEGERSAPCSLREHKDVETDFPQKTA